MKKLIAIAMCAIMVLGAAACVKKNDPKPIAEPDPSAVVDPDVSPEVVPPVDPEADPEVDPEASPEVEPVENPEETKEPEESPDQNAEIDYDNLFDFSGWEAEYEAAEDKEAFVQEFWKNKTTETLLKDDNYNLIKTDEKAKQAFLNEFREQMAAQMERMLVDEGIEIDDSMRELINSVIDEQLVNISKAFD